MNYDDFIEYLARLGLSKDDFIKESGINKTMLAGWATARSGRRTAVWVESWLRLYEQSHLVLEYFSKKELKEFLSQDDVNLKNMIEGFAKDELVMIIDNYKKEMLDKYKKEMLLRKKRLNLEIKKLIKKVSSQETSLTIDEILERIIKHYNFDNLPQLAQKWGIDISTISKWKTRNSFEPLISKCVEFNLVDAIFGDKNTSSKS